MHLSDYSDMNQYIGSAFMGFTCRKVDTGSLYQLLQVTYRIATLFLLTGTGNLLHLFVSTFLQQQDMVQVVLVLWL